ncbi:MAG: hypothetical protein WC875_00950 [Candidatus Absconditabacterales bacterium]
MQLQLGFSDPNDTTIRPDDHSADAYMNEFEQGNFSHAALQTKYSANEILDIFLTSNQALDRLKVHYLKRIGRGINNIAGGMDNEYKEHIRKHNHELRDRLAYRFAKEASGHLREHGWEKFWKYNNAHREMYGGKHFNVSVTELNHEWHKKYLIKRKEHIQWCISHLTLSHIRNPAHIITHYMSIFDTKEFIEAVNDMDLSEDKKGFIIEQITPKK